TLTGTGFVSGITVEIGGSPCTSVDVISATQLTCTAPAHAAGTVSAVVTNPDGQTDTLASAYTYQAAPTLTSISPTAGALGGSTTLTLTGTGFLTGAAVTVGGSACGSVTVVNSTTITCSTPVHAAGTVDVVIANADGQSATLASSYTYQAAPVLGSVSPTAGAVAGGTTLTLTGTGFLSGATVTVGGNA